MKKSIAALLFLLFAVQLVSGEEVTPQLAYLFLDGYVKEKEQAAGAKVGGAVTLGLGSAALTAGGVLFFFGDSITAALSPTGEAWDTQTRYVVSGALAASGLVGIGVGSALLIAPPPDYRGRFAEVYEAEESMLRESLAAAALFEMSENARRRRILSGVTNIGIPLMSLGLQMGLNVAAGEAWHNELTSVSLWQVGTVANALKSLFDRSEEEILYMRYLAARSALNGGGD